MKTNAINFWNYFLEVQAEIILAYSSGDKEKLMVKVNRLLQHKSLLACDMELEIRFQSEFNAVIYFRTKGKKRKKHKAMTFITEAPKLDCWKFYAGIPPHNDKNNPLHIYFPYTDSLVFADQIQVHIEKIYPSTNKLHLCVYVELFKNGIPKSKIRSLAFEMLKHYLGEDDYCNNISKLKVSKRKVNSKNFLPLKELKKVLRFKTPIPTKFQNKPVKNAS